MSAYNDYMVKASAYFVSLAELYCNLLSQGVEDCCIRNKMNLLGMYLDTIPRCGNENCLSTEQIVLITGHINEICGQQNWGTLTNINVLVPPIDQSGTPGTINATVLPQAWNMTIGTSPVVIAFSQALGTSGTSWGMTYTAVNSSLETVFLTITNRTASGFTVQALENNVHFEGMAILKTS